MKIRYVTSEYAIYIPEIQQNKHQENTSKYYSTYSAMFTKLTMIGQTKIRRNYNGNVRNAPKLFDGFRQASNKKHFSYSIGIQ